MVMAVMLEIFVICFAFILGMKYQCRCAVHCERKGLPQIMVKTKTGDRLHITGCVHTKQSEMDETVTTFKVCEICRSKSKQM